ncbi:response regulator transcription factor [Pullulanibacillus sp. KACC 23026]|uniref:response regulator transcription factor n=1 Tax=Pullulanibacillus sp. KACC 23026 TaxID=3028315 RepID=UPI0023AEFF87|nr:response regulator transcription factor [Pullulanibacillus sp. KACC 23026]WEG11811.1 response regulator transcription factor [Pullulanibacillus sp. KACC 23026]
MKKHIVLVKEESILTDGIVGTLEDAGYTVVTHSSSQRHVILSERIIHASLVIVDLQTHVDILEILNMCKNFNVKAVVWAANRQNELLREAFKKKLSGYFYNGMDKEELLYALEVILKNDGIYISPTIGEILLNSYVGLIGCETDKPVDVLTLREWDVLELISQGCSNHEIASRLYITDKTVKNHVSSILTKLQVKDRTSAAVMALKNNWIPV